MTGYANYQQAMLQTEGVVTQRADGTNFLLVWIVEFKDEVYMDVVAGNRFFLTLDNVQAEEVISVGDNSYIVKGAKPNGDGFSQVECQAYATTSAG